MNDFVNHDLRTRQSVVNWYRGNPSVAGIYLVAFANGNVKIAEWSVQFKEWSSGGYGLDGVVAWGVMKDMVNW